MLRPGLDDLAEPVTTLIQAAPDRHLRGHVCIFIPYAKPFTQAPFGTIPVIINGDIDPFLDHKCCRVTAGFIEELAQQVYLLDKILG